MHPAFALARKRLQEARVEFDAFLAADKEKLVPMEREDDPTSQWVRTVTRASGVEGVYSAMQGVLKEVLRVADGGVFSEGPGFHAQLLAQAGEATDDRREVISNELYVQVDQLRVFRHVERNNYRVSLKEEFLNENMRLLRRAFPVFESEISSFISDWERKPEDDDAQPTSKPGR